LRFGSESGYFKGEDVVAFYTTEDQEGVDFDDYEIIEYQGRMHYRDEYLGYFSKNSEAIQQDFDYLTADRVSQPIPASVNTIAPENILLN
jgi:hypothetical protein